MDIIEFCGSKRIKREYGNAKTPQQNRVAERKNRTLIEPITAENKANKTEGPKEANNSAVAARASNTNYVNTASTPVNTASTLLNTASTPTNQDDSQIPSLEDIYENVWTLVDCPKGVRPIRTKWVLKNKKDERGIIVRNKVRLVAQGHTQEEGIDYDEVFAPVARIKAIRLFLACASFMGFTVYQMDVKSAFLYGTIDEEVYVMQPPGFHDPAFPAKVYKVEKAMYGLHQAPRAWYVYVDDIIFGSSNPQLCKEFEALMHEKFQMSAMDVRYLNTPMDKENPWGKDGTGKHVDLHLYRSMIGSLMYLTASRPDIMFVVCDCARHQVTPKECHLHAVKRIFRYLKGHPKLRLWYLKASPFDLVAFSDSDYGRASQDRKST
nr:hypothetical protein [Tanacetum cinerariifolium]